MTDSPQEEVTGKRPTAYSLWHRTLPEECYMTDGDWFEQRVLDGDLKSVAYIETIQVPSLRNADQKYPVWKSKKELSLEIQRKMNIPAYIVWHNEECTRFLVRKISESTAREMNQTEYRRFIKNL